MNFNYLLFALGLFAGFAATLQAGVNFRMATAVSSPILASFISFFVGTLSLLIYLLATREGLGALSGAWAAPWHAWLGGILGAFFVATSLILIPRLGVAMTFSLFILGQMLTTLVIDHYGFFGLEQRSVDLPRLVGITLVIAGALLVKR